MEDFRFKFTKEEKIRNAKIQKIFRDNRGDYEKIKEEVLKLVPEDKDVFERLKLPQALVVIQNLYPEVMEVRYGK